MNEKAVIKSPPDRPHFGDASHREVAILRESDPGRIL
jgi:hypothetical protein